MWGFKGETLGEVSPLILYLCFGTPRVRIANSRSRLFHLSHNYAYAPNISYANVLPFPSSPAGYRAGNPSVGQISPRPSIPGHSPPKYSLHPFRFFAIGAVYNDATNKTQEGIKMNSQNRNKKTSLPARLRSAALAQDLPYTHILRLLAVFFAAAVMAGASLFGIARPFGLSLIAATGGIGTILAATFGNVIGSLGQSDFLPVTAASVLLCAARILLGALLSPADQSDLGLPGGKKAENPPGEMLRRIRDPTKEARPPRASVRQKIRYGAATESIWLRAAFSATAAMIVGAIRMIGSDTFTTRELLSVFFLALTVPLATLAFCTLTERQLRVTSARDAGVLTLLFAVTRAMRDGQWAGRRGSPENETAGSAPPPSPSTPA